MGSYLRDPPGGAGSRRGRSGQPRARPDRRARGAVDRLQRRVRSQPAECDGPPGTRRGRARAVRPARARRRAEQADGRRLRRDVGRRLEAWGFVRGPKRVPDAETLADARARTGWQHLRLDPRATDGRLRSPGNPDQPGKHRQGLCDRSGRGGDPRHWFPTSALVHGGQSSLFALGSPPGRFGGRWEIALRNPLRPETPLGVLRLRNRGPGHLGKCVPAVRRRTAGSTATSSTRGPASPPQADRRA